MDDFSTLVQAVESFEDTQNPLSDELEQFISHVARTGDILAPWEKVQKVFMNKLQLVLDEFYQTNPYNVGKVNANAMNDDFDEMKKRLLELAEEFDSPPFTIQRLCELLTDPRKNYTKCDKFMRGIEKNLMVVSSWNNPPRRAMENNDNMVNGVNPGPSNGFMSTDRLKPHWANLPPSPISTSPPKIPGAPDFSAVSLPKQEPAPEVVQEQKEDPPAPPTPIEPEEEETSDNTADDTDRKSNVSATIISSSPPKTINIKRKIDDSTEESPSIILKEAQVEQSPTKRLKSDSQEDKTEEGSRDLTSSSSEQKSTGNEDSAEIMSDDKNAAKSANCEDDSAKLKDDSAELKDDLSEIKDDSAEFSSPQTEDSGISSANIKTTPPSDAKMDTTDSFADKEGTSVDPPAEKTEESKMEVD